MTAMSNIQNPRKAACAGFELGRKESVNNSSLRPSAQESHPRGRKKQVLPHLYVLF